MYEYHFELERVVDGDTVDVSIDLGFGIHAQKRVRLVGINAPETRTRNSDEKRAGVAAKYRLEQLLLRDPEATCIIHTELDSTGKFGRVLGTLFVGGVDVNATLLSEGLVLPYGQKWEDLPLEQDFPMEHAFKGAPDEEAFELVLEVQPKGVNITRMKSSPVGPFDVISSEGLLAYRYHDRVGAERLSFRLGGSEELQALAQSYTK